MPSLKLSKRAIDSLPEPERDTNFFDLELKRFGLRVWRQKNGATGRMFFIQYRSGRRTRKLRIGAFGTWTAEQARERARELLRAVDDGKDPAQAKQEQRKAITIAELVDAFFKGAEAGTIKAKSKNPFKASTLKTDKGRGERHIKPVLGKMLVRDFSKDDAERFLAEVAKGKHKGCGTFQAKRNRVRVTGGEGAAKRTFALLSRIMTYAVKEKHRADNPCLGVETGKKVRRQFRMMPGDFRAYGEALSLAEQEEEHWQFVAIARLLALTGCRKNELVQLSWDEIDFDAKALFLTETHRPLKTGPRVVPLDDHALAILRGIEEDHGRAGVFVFPAVRHKGKPFGNFEKSWRELIKLPQFPHLLRHAYASVAFEIFRDELTVALLRGDAGNRSTASGYICAPSALILDAANKVGAHIARHMQLGQACKAIRVLMAAE